MRFLQVHVNQPVSTMLMDPRLPLAEYFEAKQTTGLVSERADWGTQFRI